MPSTPVVVSVSSSATHSFSKAPRASIQLVEGVGVEGDAHAGVVTQHLFQMRKDPSRPNLRQVHLIHSELFDGLRSEGFEVEPGGLGENITTAGIDLLSLPVGTRLEIGDAVVIVTGLRNPCNQINGYREGLMQRLVRKDDEGRVVRLSGVMGIVARSGAVAPGDAIRVEPPAGEHSPLAPV